MREKMPADPLVSVIIPVYNGAAFLRETLETVLAQTYPWIEVLVIDDGSTDHSFEIVRNFTDRITLISQPNQGVATTRNTGLRHAQGEYVALLDQDDLWAPDHIAKSVEFLQKNRDIDYVLARYSLFLEPGLAIPSWLKPELLQDDHAGYIFGAMLARKSVFAKTGMLDTAYKYSDDTAWFFKAKDMGVPMRHLSHVGLYKRVHAHNNSAQAQKLSRELLLIAKTSVGKQREKEQVVLDAPKISVIISVYNGAAYLSEAVESVFQQTWPHIELIIIDDGSTDGTKQVAQRYGDRLIYHYQPNQGLSAARNAGLARAAGEYIAFLDADDLWMPEKLKMQMFAVQKNPNVQMVFGLAELFHSPELNGVRKDQLKDHGKILAGYSAGTMLIKKQTLLKVGLFSAAVQIGDFVDWYARAQEAGLESLLLQEVVMKRRLHNGNMGVVLKDRRKEYLQVLRAAVKRRQQVKT